MYKSSFRAVGKRLLKHISKETKTEKMDAITDAVMNTSIWQNANTIACTIPRSIELDTHKLIEQAWMQQKQVVIPKCYPENDNQMTFYQYTSREELENVYLDLYEPLADEKKLTNKRDIDLIIVPGLLFDKEGFRIGYGGGYYDRYLEDYNGQTISIAMDEQIVPHLPYDSFDQPVQTIITDKKIITPL
ncbi:5-formyltetrahydrofolate cyclo-ligase [Halalkalibacillus sediminis]|uniref:5-formyltetrahydrofolate cyclo-ligase n=1 Tax=Halalkalibacillus sediminis TaxID=2018042 RepID=A0A2I0QXC8_9BACI|nr:5-formyltetrahydrofolate cyclo-ligase [Halalkalibacillus sediminis]PKR78997.1 5-formyltetrahydrofolate cyclo-ligase [Halalkalibacillus sediminis]